MSLVNFNESGRIHTQLESNDLQISNRGGVRSYHVRFLVKSTRSPSVEKQDVALRDLAGCSRHEVSFPPQPQDRGVVSMTC